MSEPAPETRAARLPLRELLPKGLLGVVVAVASVALVAASFSKFGASGEALLGAVLCPTLVLLAAIDFKHRVLPNVIVFPAMLAIGLIVAVNDPGGFLTHLAAGAALGFFFFAIAALIPGSIGMGDAKLGFLLGLALGSRTLGAITIALLGLLLAALWILARQGMGARKQTIPFGPFLALGGILGFFLG